MIAVGIITMAVLIYAQDYMRNDLNRNTFYIILSVFGLFMSVLVLGNNYVVMFIG
jgi:NADH:ubiquinone oxidoreductase subunit 5 (subunit L)/multisubunit Na+/H+ antiporter MnhA subunit